MVKNHSRWSLLAVLVGVFCLFLIAATIVLSLIPLYLSIRSVTPEDEGLPFNNTYIFTEGQLNLALPLNQLPSGALLFIQKELQRRADADPVTGNVTVVVQNAQLLDVTPASSKKRQASSTVRIRLAIQGILFIRRCRTRSCKIRVRSHAISITWAQLFPDLKELIRLILLLLNRTTTTTTRTTSITVTSGVPAGLQTTSSPVGKRRRRSALPSLYQPTGSVSIGGALVISLDTATDFVNQLQQTHTSVSRLPLGVQVIPAVDGRQIDLYAALREQKISKVIYDQLIRQDRTIGGAHLTMGSLGCLESHVLAWNKVLQLNKPMLVLEDDVHLKAQLFDTMLPYLLNSLPSDFSLLYFGNLVGKSLEPQLIDYDDLLWKINGSSWGTFAYLISPLGAAVLLDNIYPVQAQVDSMIIDIASKQSLKTFMSKSLLVKTDNSFRRQSMTQVYLVPPLVIPRIFHFIWMGDRPLSSSLQKHMKQWKDLHPSWEIRLWTSHTLAASDLNMYNIDEWTQSTRGPRQAADILRYEVIYQYGGVFVDADFEPLKNIEPILHGVEAFVAHETEPFICNGLYGAIPGHELSRRLVTTLSANMKTYSNSTVNQQTGPYHMTRQVQSLKDDGRATMKDGFRIFAPIVFFPYAWYEKDPGAPYDASSYTVHHFRSLEEIDEDFRRGQ